MIALISDSSSDLGNDLIIKNNVIIVPFLITFDKENYLRENVDITNQEFYIQLEKASSLPKTSLPSVSSYSDVFEEEFKKGNDVLCICLSSKLSGSFQSACTAKEVLADSYPDRKIEIIDSMQASYSQGAVVIEARKLIDAGTPIEKIETALKPLMTNSSILFSLDSLEYLQKGGRIGKAASLVGGVLNVKPIIRFSDGELNAFAKVRGRKKAISEIISVVESQITEHNGDFDLAVLHVPNYTDPDDLLVPLKEKYPDKNIAVAVVGVTIGVHVGPTAYGVAVMKY